MTPLQEALQLLEDFEYREPSPAAVACLAPHRKGRFAALWCIKGRKGHCVWCGEVGLPARRKKYCSDRCSASARMYAGPQNPMTKAWVLIHRQHCACRACGLDWEPKIIELIHDRENHRKERNAMLRRSRLFTEEEKKRLTDRKVSYLGLGDQTGEIWEVDHIVPLFKGGDGIGLENIQVICVACHRQKTARER